MKQEEYPLLGLHCAGCAGRAEAVLSGIEGVERAEVNLAAASARVQYDEERVRPTELARAIAEAGYQLLVEAEWQDDEEVERLKAKELRRLELHTFLALALAGLMMLSMLWGHSHELMWLQAILSLVLMATAGRGFYERAYRQLQTRAWGMDSLVALSTLVAYVYSLALLIGHRGGEMPTLYFESSVMIIAFVLLGKYLEARAGRRTSEALRQLSALQPKEVLRLAQDGTEELVPISKLYLGDSIIVRAGERVAVDGLVLSGESYVDEQMLTGEAMPQRRSVGDSVYAGSINQNGSLTVRALALHRDTLLGRIIQRVRSAQGSKAPVQRLVDKVAGIFVPIIMLLSVLTFVGWIVFAGWDRYEEALISAITVLVIACPCALGLATPTAIMVGIGRAAERGILIKDAESLELAKRVDTIVFDKTGTLTEGKPSLLHTDYWSGSMSEAQCVALLRALEGRSEHPIARAILEALPEQAELSYELDSWIYLPGYGISAVVAGETYLLGNPALMEREGISLSPEQRQRVVRYTSEQATPILLGRVGEGVLMTLGLRDRLKATSTELVGRLRAEGYKLWLLTGDAPEVAGQMASELGISNWRAGVLPEEKANFVAELRRSGAVVAMVGDGINDSAALAEADLSVAMGTGSDIAIETAQATLTTGDVALLPELFALSRATLRTIRRNLFWAFVYNLLAIPLAAGLFYPLWGLRLTPMLASLMMAMSSVSVVVSSLALRHRR